jgi:hypothetical protein
MPRPHPRRFWDNDGYGVIFAVGIDPMNTPVFYVGALNSALYLAGCFIAGLVTQNGSAWRLALISAGFAFLAYNLILAENERAAKYLAAASWIVGMAAGIALLG